MIPRHRFTVTPVLVALLTALVHLPMLTIVKVNAFGMGFEHEQGWRRVTNGLRAALISLTRLPRPTLLRLPRRPVLVRCVLLAAVALVIAWCDPQTLWALPIVFGVLTEARHAGEFMLEERAMGGIGTPSRENIVVLSGQVLKAGAVIGRVNKGVGRTTIPAVVGTGNGTMTQVFAGPEVQVGNYVVTATAAVVHGGVFSVTSPSGKALPTFTMTPGAGGTTTYRTREINFSVTDGSTDFIVGDAFTIVVDTTAPAVIGTGNGTVSGITLGADAVPGNYRLEIVAAVTNGGQFKLTAPDGDIVDEGFIVAGAGGTYVGGTKRQLNFTLTDGATDFALGDAFNIAVFNQLVGGSVVAWDPTAVDGRDDVAGILFDNVDATAGALAGVIIARDATVIKSSLEWAAAISAAQKESAYRDLEARGIICR